MNIKRYNASPLKGKVQELAMQVHALREDGQDPQDISLVEAANLQLDSGQPYESLQALLEDTGVELRRDTISNLLTTDVTNDVKWLVPELIRDAVRLGMRRAPVYPNIIASEETINAQKVQVPYMNMVDSTPRYVGEGETITLSELSYGAKEFKVRKMGRGIKLTDELRRYSSVNIVSMFLQDFGVRLGYGLDSLAINVLLNGEQADGSESAPVIGVNTIGSLVYKDLLKVWIRLTRMGKNPATMVGGESMAEDILDLPEFKKSNNTAAPEATLNLRAPVPTRSDFFIHGSIPADQVIILDKATTMAKFNSMPLKVESERIVSNQTEATYVSLATGFAVLFRDSRIVLDKSTSFETNPFPDYMNVDAMAMETIK